MILNDESLKDFYDLGVQMGKTLKVQPYNDAATVWKRLEGEDRISAQQQFYAGAEYGRSLPKEEKKDA